VPELSVDNLTVLVVVSLGLSTVLTLAVVLLALRLRGIRHTYARLLNGGGRNEDILAAVTRHVTAVERLDHKVNQLGRQSAEHRQRISGLVRTVGFVRYDAFSEMGGQLSYSLALLDEAGDGIVLTAINGRAETRSYAKEVKGGQSTHNLSDEEQAAIDMAFGQSRPLTIRV
jgi:Protein of unknown function (DUF4446)